MNSPSHTDSNIPVLTEVILDDGLEFISDTLSFDQPEKTVTAHLDLPIQTNLAHEKSWEQLEKRLHENVLRQLLSRVDFVLEHRVRDSLADALQTAVDDLTKQIRQGLTNTLEEVLQRAISQEISKLQSSHSKK